MKRVLFIEIFNKIHNTVEIRIHCCEFKTVETVEKFYFSLYIILLIVDNIVEKLWIKKS